MARFSHHGANESFMRQVNVENIPTFLLVVAAAITSEEGHLLLQQALPGKRHAGMWEFPGGKVEAFENPTLALMREVREELAIELNPAALQPVGFAEEAAGEGRPGIVLLLYRCDRWRGEPEALEGQNWGWFTLNEAASLPMASMDKALLQALIKEGA
jgi:8-oxo-dGTP diphosphatase